MGARRGAASPGGTGRGHGLPANQRAPPDHSRREADQTASTNEEKGSLDCRIGARSTISNEEPQPDQDRVIWRPPRASI